MEENINCITLEDGLTYAVVDEIKINNITYVYLSNINNSEDFCIRKIIIENNKEYLQGLNNKEEFEKAILTFSQKYKEELQV